MAAWAFVPPAAGGAELTRDYLTDVWTSEDGLPDSSVTAIAQTPDGYLWLGTYNGLARFDGVRFVTFDPGNTPALQHARIRKLYVDARGTLWINTYDGSLTTYRQGQFTLERHNTRLSESEMTPVGSSSNQIVFLESRGELLRKPLTAPPGEGWQELPPPGRGLDAQAVQDSRGVIWDRDGDRRLWRLTGSRFEPVPEAGTNLNCLTTDAAGNLWIGADSGFEFWDGRHFQDATPANSDWTAPLKITALAIASDGEIWAVADGWVVKADRRRWLLPPAPERRIYTGEFGRVGIQPDHHGGAWFYNYGRGLIHVDAAGQVRPLTTTDGFPGDRVYCLFEDREGDEWAGLDAAGLVRVREAQCHTVGAADDATARATKSVCQDAHGVVWIGLLSGGLERWQDGTWTNLPAPDGNALGSVFCLCPDARGQLWTSTGNEDLYVGRDGHFQRVTPLIHGVKAILADHAGRVWVGTTSGLFVSPDGSPEHFQSLEDFPRHNVRALAEDQNGAVWAGTGNGELFRIAGDSIAEFQPPDAQAGAIWSVLAEPDGTIWAGTFRGGLLRLRDGQFIRYTARDGLPDNVICQVLDDGRGHLWLGTHHGVFCVAKSALDDFARGKVKFISGVAYGRSDGLPSLECSGGYQPSGWRDRQGRLWFATAKGAAWLQPDELHPNPVPPPVVIEEVLVDGRVQSGWPPPSAGRAPLLVIPPGKHQVEFRYTGLSLASPERVQFRYRLEGVDADWVQAGTRRFVQYNLLPPGNYRFRVIAGNSDGVWNKTGAALELRIRPHFYETWWFEVLAAFSILAGVAGTARHLATRRLRRQMEELERRQAVERERARIAKDIHDDLGASLTLIAVLGDLARKEKTAERIEKISRTAREAVKSLDEIVWAVNPRNDTLAHLVDYTAQFAQQYLRDADIRCRLDVPEHLPAREVPANVRHNVFLAVKEALQNIVKHARATEVWLRISFENPHRHPPADVIRKNPSPESRPTGLRIVIEDNGCGFDRAPADAWANGLHNMRQRLTEIGGQCRVHSRAGAGTTLTVELPLTDGPSHKPDATPERETFATHDCK